MDFWDILQYAAWAGAIALIFWMVMDAVKVGKTYSEDVLTSSQEGVDELAIQQQHDTRRAAP